MKKTKFSDIYTQSHGNFRYISNNIPYVTFSVDDDILALREDFVSTLENQCQCTETDNCDTCHESNYLLTTELVLNPERPCKDLIYECSSCACKNCNNRLVQHGPRNGMEVQDFGVKGKGR